MRMGDPLTLDALRSTLDDTRARFKSDPETVLPSTDADLSPGRILSLRMDGCDSAPRDQCHRGNSPHQSWPRTA